MKNETREALDMLKETCEESQAEDIKWAILHVLSHGFYYEETARAILKLSLPEQYEALVFSHKNMTTEKFDGLLLNLSALAAKEKFDGTKRHYSLPAVQR